MPLVLQLTCGLCGAVFDSPRRPSHGIALCSEECRRRRQSGYARTWALANPDKTRKARQAWKKRNPDKHRWSHRQDEHQGVRARRLRRLYSITEAEYDTLWQQQMGRCAICLEGDNERQPLVVDHDHRTKEIRSLLCRRCNSAIGFLRDNPGIAQRATWYLRIHQDELSEESVSCL